VLGLASLVALGGCATKAAEEAPAELPAGSAEARLLVERFNAKLLDVARRSEALGQRGREAELRPLALASFDVPFMARAALGNHWETLTPDQRELWVATYTEFHVVAMAFNWRSAQGARFTYLGEVPAPGGTVLVKTRLDRSSQGADVRRDYRVRFVSGRWRIIDVFTPGYVSQVGMRRSEYLTVLTRTDFDGLIADMERRIETRRRE